MPRRYYPPASLRYLKARLWNLARPSFWVTAILLSLVGLVIKEYWTNPDFLTQKQKPQVASHQSTDPYLSEEDKAIAADIDSLPVLYNDAEQTSLQRTASTPQENNQLTNGKDLSDDLSSKGQAGASHAQSNPGGDTGNYSSAPKLENPFLTQAENVLQEGLNSSTASSIQPGVAPNTSSIQPGVVPTSTSLGVGSANQTNYSQSVAPVSPSQTTINPSINQNLPSFNSNTTSIGPNSYVGQSLPTNNSLGQIPPPTTGVSRDTLTPSTVTGYTQPPPITQVQNPYSTLNPYSDLQSNYQGLNRFSNRYNNLNSGQAFPSAVPSTSVVSPATSAAPTYTTPYYPQTQNPGVTNNYGSSGLQQPAQVSQYNLSYPRQNVGQYPSGGQINGYSYP